MHSTYSLLYRPVKNNKKTVYYSRTYFPDIACLNLFKVHKSPDSRLKVNSEPEDGFARFVQNYIILSVNYNNCIKYVFCFYFVEPIVDGSLVTPETCNVTSRHAEPSALNPSAGNYYKHLHVFFPIVLYLQNDIEYGRSAFGRVYKHCNELVDLFLIFFNRNASFISFCSKNVFDF